MEIFKDENGIYKVSFTGLDGKTFVRTTKMTNLADAKKVVAMSKIPELEMAAKAKALNGESLTAIMAGRKVSCTEAMEEWKVWQAKHSAANTARTRGIIVNQFLRVAKVGSLPVPRLTFDIIDAFVNEKSAKRAARDLRLASVRSFIVFCSARAYLVGDPSKLVKVRIKGMTHEQREAKPRVPVTEAELKLLLAKTEGFWKHAIALSYWTGLRLSDICCLEWDCITSNSIILWTQKTETRVEVPLHEPLIGGGQLSGHFLDMLMQGNGEGYIFPEERKTILDPDKRAKLSVYAGRIFARAGVEGKSFHCLRHSFVTRLSKAGKTLEEIGKIVGHSNTETTKGYAH